jgi:flavin reductase (DIM6/NTAB) family NADH-FMN oxidoreductase RutF
MKKINEIEYASQIMESLDKGGFFLNSKLGDKINSMTIGWGSLSIYWGESVFIAPVRLSRFTHHMIEQSGVFTVSVPLDGALRKELGICGSKSGRDTDKFALCNFTAVDGQSVDCPIIGEAQLHIECEVVAADTLDASKMSGDIVDKMYAGDYENGDYHTLFFGKIVDCYILE